MLLRDLKQVANDCIFNPRKPSKDERILMDVGNPTYWTVKVMELIRRAQELAEGSTAYNRCIREATTLLILTRAHINETTKKDTKTRKRTSGSDSKTPETP